MERLIFLISAVFFFSACTEQNELTEHGSVAFSLQFPSMESTDGRTLAQDRPSALLLSIQDGDGNTVIERDRIELIHIGEDFLVAENLELEAGNYQIIEFMVMSEANEILYVTPVKGSLYGPVVATPLPYDIVVIPDGTITVPMEVLRVEDGHSATDFGILGLAINLTNRFEVHVSVLQDGGPTEGVLDVDAFRDGSEAYTLEFIEVGLEGRDITLFDNLDSARFTIDGVSGFEAVYSLEELQESHQVVLSIPSS